MELNSNLSAKGLYDWELVKRAKEGDQKAYAELLGRYRDTIYFMLFKMIKNKDDADDLTMEAFGKAFKGLDQYTPSFAFSTWLFKIATNNCIDFIRRRKESLFSIDKVYETAEGEPFMIEPASPLLNPEEKAMRKQKIQLMQAVVEKLPARYRTLVELRYFHEKSYEEISEELDLPIGTIKVQLFRAREVLYHILKHMQWKI